MKQKQRENVSKFMYDISKVVFSVAVIGNVLTPHKSYSWDLLWGFLIGVMFFTVGFWIDGKEKLK